MRHGCARLCFPLAGYRHHDSKKSRVVPFSMWLGSGEGLGVDLSTTHLCSRVMIKRQWTGPIFLPFWLPIVEPMAEQNPKLRTVACVKGTLTFMSSLKPLPGVFLHVPQGVHMCDPSMVEFQILDCCLPFC